MRENTLNGENLSPVAVAEDGRAKAYQTNALNQYTAITEEGAAPFHPTYDANGNQTLIQTATGIWAVDYDFHNQPIKFTRGTTVITCGYDYMGRRWFRKITEDGTVVKHERYLYRGYQQIATVDLMQPEPTVRHVIIWDPSEPTATRPLALLAGGQLYLYGVDFSKNVTELMDSATGTLAATYDYSPFGALTSSGGLAAVNPLQWSSEVYDPATALVYYNYRYLNTTDGRWISRDRIAEQGGLNLYEFVRNNPVYSTDYLGNYLPYIDYFHEPQPNAKGNRCYGLLEILNTGWGVPDTGRVNQTQLNKLNELKNKLEAMRDKLDRPCYEVKIDRDPLSDDGVKALSLMCDQAFLHCHSRATQDGFVITTGGYDVSSNDVGKNVNVFGCHLAAEWGGRGISQENGLDRLLEKLEQLPQKDCCEKVEKIMVATGTVN